MYRMPSSEHSESSRHSRHCDRNRHHRGRDDYYFYEYEYGPNPLALYYLNRPYGGYYGGYGLGRYGLGYGPGFGYGAGLGYGPGLGYGRGYGLW
jgi:hypothetical protein